MTRSEPVPEGWHRTTLGKLANYVNGRAFKPTEWGPLGRPIIRIQNLTGSTDVVNRFDGDVEERHIVRPGDLLLSWAATLGVFVWDGEEAALNQHIFKVHPTVDVRFMRYLLENTLAALKSQVHGTGMQHITKGKFEATPVVIPESPDEQKRIVARIEELMSDVDAGTRDLEVATAHGLAMRGAVLDAAFRGSLLGLGEDTETGLPRGWRWGVLGDPEVADVSGGITKNAKRASLPDKRPYLRVANVYADELRLDEMKEIGVTPSEAERFLLREGDLLIVEGNGSKGHIGRVGLWDGSVPNCVHQNHLIRARPSLNMNPRFLLLWLLSGRGRAEILKRAHTTSGLYTLSTSKVASLPVPLADSETQDRVVIEADAALSLADDLLTETATARRRAESLRQSILRAAFSGQLV